MDYTPLPSRVQSSHPHPYVQDPVLYISNLPPHVTDDHLATIFQYCTPFKLNILRDATNRSQSEQTLSGSIEFESIDAAEKALATLQSRPIQGLRPPAPLILAPYPPTSPPTLLPSPTVLPRLVRFLPFDFTESKLYDLFRPCGALASVRMHVGIGDYTSGVVEFWHEEDAHFADKAMHRFQVEDGLIVMSKYDQGLGVDTSDHDEPSSRPTTPESPGHVYDTSLVYELIPSSSFDWSGAVKRARIIKQQVCDNFPVDPCNLFCKNLDLNIDESRLSAHFHQFGRIVNTHVIRDELGKSCGLGIITFGTPDRAAAAMHDMNGAPLGSKNLILSRQAVPMPRVGNDVSQNAPSVLKDSHDAPVQKPRQPMDMMGVEEPEARPVDSRAKQSIECQTGVSINDIFSRSPFDLTGQVTKSGHHPFAKGSYGDIYRGTYCLGDKSINVAIKTSRMYLEHDQELPKKMKVFLARKSLQQKILKHPNILPFLGAIVDASTNPDIPAIVSLFAENGTLTTYLCERDDELTITKRLTLVNDVALGLQYLHSQQIVHGDLSGSNLLIDSEGKACITDFGLSTLLTHLGGSTFTTTRQAKGTMRWMAPEVLDPDDSMTTPTMESDTYSFGSIMLQIFTGKIPYHHLARDEHVVFAIVKGTKHTRPDTDAITDHRWKFMEWCWSPAKASKSRPSSDEISEFSRKELAKVMTTDQEVKLATSASTSTTTAPRLKLPAAESGLAHPSTPGVTLPEDDLLVVEPAGGLIHGVDDRPRLIQEQQVVRPSSHTIAYLARLPAVEIIEFMNTPLADHLLPKADPSVVKTTDEFINGLLDKPQQVQKQIVGEKLFHTIKSYGIRDSPRVTIALLDQEDLRSLAHLMDSYPSILKEKALIMKASLDSR